MHTRLPLAAALVCLAGINSPAVAQDQSSGAKRKLDTVLSVLRGHQNAARKPCLEAMTRVHQTEDQVADLGQQASNSNHPDNGADVARDVLDSDYETAEAACLPDAVQACKAFPTDPACAKLGGGDPG